MIAGVKLTHDASVCLIDGNEVVFCHEAEKIDNRPRHDTFSSINEAVCHLPSVGFSDIAVDGWKHGILAKHGFRSVEAYHEFDTREPGVPLRAAVPVHSYFHFWGHVVGSYMMSPFAAAGEPATVLCWDGGSGPLLYTIEPGEFPTFVKRLFPYYAYLYGIMNYYAGPLKPDGWLRDEEEDQFGERAWPGKIMSWIRARQSFSGDEVVAAKLWDECIVNGTMTVAQDGRNEHNFMEQLKGAMDHLSDRSFLSLVHDTIGMKLIDGLRGVQGNLIFTGGAALNIKWNSLIRHFHKSLWVPPCPNDSGSAIGAAACLSLERGVKYLKWNVYCGKKPTYNLIPRKGWTEHFIMDGTLAHHLHDEPDEPIVIVSGRAELGPRALGNRSIIANPKSVAMREKLNAAKQREEWRPIAPICTEEDAGRFFSPGTPDPYMLFDHNVLPLCRELAPAVVHEDGTARLQTVTAQQNPTIHKVAETMGKLSGCPIICNTSANHSGRGFFPDSHSAMDWCDSVGINKVFSGIRLFQRRDRIEGKATK